MNYENPFIKTDKSEFLRDMLKESYNFVEFYKDNQFRFYKRARYTGIQPKRFHPSAGDKLIIKNIMEKAVNEEIPEKIYCKHNSRILARRILFERYYYDYANNDE